MLTIETMPIGGPSSNRWICSSTLRRGAGPHQRFCIGGNLQKARQHQGHEDANGRGVVLVTWEFTVEDLRIVTPPGPGSGADGQLLDFVLLFFFDAIYADKVPDVAHLGPFPLVGLEAADLAPAPVQDVAGMVGGVARPEPRRGELAGQPTLGDGGTVGFIAHSGFPSLTGALSCLTRYTSCDSQIKVLVYPKLGARSSSVVELAVACSVEEALPLMPVEYQDPLFRITRHSHQDPLGAVRGGGCARRCRCGGR